MQKRYDDITGVILVGGQSRRMGRDKAFLELDGRPLFERVLDLFMRNFSRVALVGNRGERFAGYGLEVVPDVFPGSALGGLYAGLLHAETDYVFVSPCDLPFPSAEILCHICSLKDGYDAVVPTTAHGYEPLFALYAKSCLPPIRELLDRGEYCAYAYYPQVRVRFVTPDELAPLDPEGKAFLNLNTPEQFAKLAG